MRGATFNAFGGLGFRVLGGALLATFSGRDVAAVLWAYASLEALSYRKSKKSCSKPLQTSYNKLNSLVWFSALSVLLQRRTESKPQVLNLSKT